MQETKRLIETLKRCLKAAGMSYRNVADALGLSEASIKRIFSEYRFSLTRLEAICALLDMRIADLSQLAQRVDRSVRQLTVEQESALAGDPQLLRYFYRLLNGWQADAIARDEGLSDAQSIRRLAQLDRLKLIDLLPGNAVRLKVGPQVAWLTDGPLWKRYAEAVQQHFLDGGFRVDGANLQFESAEVSYATLDVMNRKLRRLAREFNELVELDIALKPAERTHVGMMLAIRPWQFTGLFETEPKTA